MSNPRAQWKTRASTKHQLYQRAVITWLCLTCLREHRKPSTPKHYLLDVAQVARRPAGCHRCHSGDIEKFDSLAELSYAYHLLALKRMRVIEDLEFHPAYNVAIEPHAQGGQEDSFTYTPDGRYVKDGKLVVYEVKPGHGKEHDEKDFMLRHRIVQAVYGIKIDIIRR